MSPEHIVISAIDESPMNRGLSGAAWLAHPGNIPVVLDRDVALFDDEGGGVYQAHFLFVSRGKAALASARESLRRMFEQHGAAMIFAMAPDFRREVKLIARWMGGRFVGKRATSEGVCELFVLSKEMWSDQWAS